MTENIILKLSSGEEIVCRLVSDENGNIDISNPLLLSSIPKVTRLGIEESVSLRRWVHFAEEEVFTINKDKVILKADASIGLSRFYELCVLRMLEEETGFSEIPTEEELREIELEEEFDEYDSYGISNKTIH
jgi:hypothetical protein